MTYCDAHIHLAQCKSFFSSSDEYFCVSSCHSKDDLDFVSSLQNGWHTAFGIHPQELFSKLYRKENKTLLEDLLKNRQIVAIGECGFDFFTPELKATESWQTEVFEFQLKLAIEHKVPMVLHLRKAVHKVFEYKKQLKKVPSVIFHSFPGTSREAEAILNNGINGYFSFGKPVINGKKSAIECVKELSLDRLLLETDAPYQTLKGESFTSPDDIKKVYQCASELKKINLETLCFQIKNNFEKAFHQTAFKTSE